MGGEALPAAGKSEYFDRVHRMMVQAANDDVVAYPFIKEQGFVPLAGATIRTPLQRKIAELSLAHTITEAGPTYMLHHYRQRPRKEFVGVYTIDQEEVSFLCPEEHTHPLGKEGRQVLSSILDDMVISRRTTTQVVKHLGSNVIPATVLYGERRFRDVLNGWFEAIGNQPHWAYLAAGYMAFGGLYFPETPHDEEQ